MISLTNILGYGSILSLTLGVIIMASLYINPRLWLQDYPKEIRAIVPPNTPAEKRGQYFMMIPVLGLFIIVPMLAVWHLESINGGSVSYLTAFATVALILNIFNLFDAVVIDFLILTVMKPRFAFIPGTENMLHYLFDWRLQVSNFFRGIVISTLLSLPIALVSIL
jgi:hypothetical protein